MTFTARQLWRLAIWFTIGSIIATIVHGWVSGMTLLGIGILIACEADRR